MTTLTEFLDTLADQSAALEHNKQTKLNAVNHVIVTIGEIGQQISDLLRLGALADIHGEAGAENIQGEAQKKLDVIANDLLLDALTANKHCAGVASEELDHATSANANGELLVLFDPLDGSSNIDINMPVGTIFSILPYNNQGRQSTDTDFLQKGVEQLAAGYLLYGSSTMLALTFNSDIFNANGSDDANTNNDDNSDDNSDDKLYKHGVVMFSLDPKSGEYVLIKDNVNIDADTQEYAINSSNYRHWLAPIQQYVNELIQGSAGVRGKDYNTRWVAAMVGDVHRILCRGGIFLYPYDTKDANKAGKLRLMYEANPMSLLIEQAGGASTDGTKRIMAYEPTDIHQRVPVVLGSRNEVDYVKTLHDS